MVGVLVRASVVAAVVLAAGGGVAGAVEVRGGVVRCDVAELSARAAQLRAQGRDAEARAVEQRIRACEDAERDNRPLFR